MILLGDEELAALGEEPISRRINSFLSESAAEQATSESSPFQYAILPNTCELDKIQEELRHLELDRQERVSSIASRGVPERGGKPPDAGTTVTHCRLID